MKKNRLSVLMLAFAMTAVLLLAGCAGQSESAEPAEPEAETETEAAAEEGSVIDYMVLVNQSNPLPEARRKTWV